MLRIISIFVILCLMKAQLCNAFLDGYMEKLDRIFDLNAERTGERIEQEFKFLRFSGFVRQTCKKEQFVEVEKLVFEVNKEIDQEDGIELISKIINVYLHNMYSDKEMMIYLMKHPFTYKNLEIKLFVYGKNGCPILHPKIGTFTLSNGNISYRTEISNEKIYLEEKSYIKEPYEEAAKRLGVWPPPMPEISK